MTASPEAQARRCAAPRRPCGVLPVRLGPRGLRALILGFG